MFSFNRFFKRSNSNSSPSQNTIEAQAKLKVAAALEKIRSLEISQLDQYADSMLANNLDKLIFRRASIELETIVNKQAREILFLSEKRRMTDIFISNYNQFQPINMDEHIDGMEKSKQSLNSKLRPIEDSLLNHVTRLNLCLRKLGEKEVDLQSYGIGNIEAKTDLPDDNNNNNASISPMRK